jgi:hypothetical protein
MTSILVKNVQDYSVDVSSYPITMRDLTTLCPETWLNDTICTGRGTARSARTRWCECRYVPVHTFRGELSDDWTRKDAACSTEEYNGQRQSIVHHCEHGKEQALGRRGNEKTITIFGSDRMELVHVPYTAEVDNIGRDLIAWANAEAQHITNEDEGVTGTRACLQGRSEWIILCCDRCTQQNNQYDCGIFALAAVATRTRGLPPNTVVDTSEQRLMIAA